MRLPRRSSGFRTGESPPTTSTQRVGRRLVFEYPVAAGDAGIERAARDVARHLLRAHEETAEPGVVDRREVAARVGLDLPARAAEELDGRLLEAPLGDAELEDVHPADGGSSRGATTRQSSPSTRRKKQLA